MNTNSFIITTLIACISSLVIAKGQSRPFVGRSPRCLRLLHAWWSAAPLHGVSYPGLKWRHVPFFRFFLNGLRPAWGFHTRHRQAGVLFIRITYRKPRKLLTFWGTPTDTKNNFIVLLDTPMPSSSPLPGQVAAPRLLSAAGAHLAGPDSWRLADFLTSWLAGWLDGGLFNYFMLIYCFICIFIFIFMWACGRTDWRAGAFFAWRWFAGGRAGLLAGSDG